MSTRRPVGFRSQLFFTVTFILAIVVVASTTVTFLVTRAQAYQSVGDLARAQLGQYTRLGVFAAIVGPENKNAVDRFFDEMNGQQALVAVELRGSSGGSLGQWGSEKSALKACGFDRGAGIATHPEVVRRNGYWCAIGPIRQSARDNQHSLQRADSVIGELRLVDSVAETRRVVRRLAAWTFGAGLCVLWVGFLLAWRGVRRLTDPLDQLAEVMRQIREGRSKVRARLKGPAEVVAIATVFNELLARLEREAETLEMQVEERTKELRAASETARNAVRYKSVFMATVTHEMRTPLHIINSHAVDAISELEFVEQANTPRRHMAVILRQADELLQRVNQILELARAESQTGVVETQAIDLSAFTADMRERSAPLAQEHGNVLQMECDPLTIESDRDKLWVILSNLVTNACKFTRAGMVQVEIRVREEMLDLSVRDTGVGITRERQATLWHEFTQVEKRQGRGAGFGLGLAIVKRLTDVLRGQVELTSEPGKGTFVRIRVPVGCPTDRAQEEDGARVPRLPATHRSPQ
jgi:signal transduction histidine kinase